MTDKVRRSITTKRHWPLKATDWVFHTGRICHVWCNFYPGYTCWTTIILGTVKDSSLKIISLLLLLSNACICKNILRQLFVKNGFKNFAFLSKNSKFCTFWIIRFGSISPVCGSHTYQICTERLWNSSVSICNGSTKKNYGKFTAEIGF